MKLEHAKEMALKWKARPGSEWFLIDVKKADRAFSEWTKGYVKRGEYPKEKRGSRKQIEEFFASHKPDEVLSPSVVFVERQGQYPMLIFRQGRMRFCVLRDAGVDKMYVSGMYPSRQIAKESGILIEDNKEKDNG